MLPVIKKKLRSAKMSLVVIAVGALGLIATTAHMEKPKPEIRLAAPKQYHEEILPQQYNGSSSRTVVLYIHGAGEHVNETFKLDDPFVGDVLRSLHQQGLILAAIQTSDGWGGQSTADQYASYYHYLDQKYHVKGVVLLTRSMGGLDGLRLVANHEIPVESFIGLNAITNLESAYKDTEYKPNILAAYQSTPAKIDQVIKKNNPMELSPLMFIGPRYLFISSITDEVALKRRNADALKAKLFPAADVDIISSTGNHADARIYHYGDAIANFVTLQ